MEPTFSALWPPPSSSTGAVHNPPPTKTDLGEGTASVDAHSTGAVAPGEAGPAVEARPRPNGRPWVATNMIMSLDGAVAVDGLSGELGGPADRAVFEALRASADAVIVGARTATLERYRRPRSEVRHTGRRAELGLRPHPRLVIVSNSLSVDPDIPAFEMTEPDRGRTSHDRPDDDRPIVVCSEQATSADRRISFAERSELWCHPGPVDLASMLGQLARHGIRVALLEGGPGLNEAFVAADLIDEWNATVAPLLVGTDAKRAAAGDATEAGSTVPLELVRLWSADGMLFGRWQRPR